MKTSEFINEEISKLFCSKKFAGGRVVVGGDMKLLQSQSAGPDPRLENVSESQQTLKTSGVDLNMIWTPSLKILVTRIMDQI